MTFTKSQKEYIRNVYEDIYTVSSKYALVYKPNNEYKTTWSLANNPQWDWEHYEYRLLKYLDRPIVKSEVEDVYVYCYNGMIYYNDPNNELRMSYLIGKNERNSLSTAMAVGGDFTVLGNNAIFGDDITYDAVLKLVGETAYNSFTAKILLGPKIRFQSTEDKNDGYISLLYSDKQANENTGLVDPQQRPYLRVDSLNKDEYVCIPRKENLISLKVGTKKVENLESHIVKATKLTSTINFKDKQQICKIFFPIGCFYWTSDKNFIPDDHFGGNWERVKNTFMYATGFADQNVRSAQHGEERHTLTAKEQCNHTHSINDPGHNHSVWDPGHSHGVNDPGHMHSIRTIGDDYNGSNCRSQRGTGNFVQDGWNDMSSENWRRGIWANWSTTSISIRAEGTHIGINGSGSGLWMDTSWGGGKSHENMPPYLAAFCWHRVS